MKINELKQDKTSKLERLQAIKNEAEKNKRSLNKDENKEVKTLLSDVKNLTSEIEVAEEMERSLKDLVKKETKTVERKDNKEVYSSARALNNFLEGKREGYEFDVHNKLQKDLGIRSKGLLIPVAAFRGANATTSTLSGLVNVKSDGIVKEVGKLPIWETIGLNIFPASKGTYKMSYDAALTGESKDEDGSFSGSAMASIVKTLEPKRKGIMRSTSIELVMGSDDAFTNHFLNRMLVATDRVITQDILSEIISSATAVTGATTLNSTGINKLAEVQEADINAAYLMNRTNFWGGVATSSDTGSGIPLFKNLESAKGIAYNGEDVVYSKLFNSDELVYGDLNQVDVADWGVIEIIEDPYTKKATGEVEYVVNRIIDVAANPYAFSKTVLA